MAMLNNNYYDDKSLDNVRSAPVTTLMKIAVTAPVDQSGPGMGVDALLENSPPNLPNLISRIEENQSTSCSEICPTEVPTKQNGYTTVDAPRNPLLPEGEAGWGGEADKQGLDELILAQNQFPPEIRHYLKAVQRQSDETVANLEMMYRYRQPEIAGAPAINALTEADRYAVELLPGYSSTADGSWERLRQRAARCMQAEDDAGNPYVAKFFLKTEDKPSPWMQGMRALSDQQKISVATVTRSYAPSGHGRRPDDIIAQPIVRIETLEIIVSTLVRYGKTILVTTGESLNKEWQYAPMVSLLVGLGSTVVRTFFDQLGIDDDYIQYLASASDKDLYREALEASKMSGYPWGLLRCPFNEIEDALGDVPFDVTPRWLILLTLLHIVKHTRIAVSDSGDVQIIVTYDGRRSFFPVMKDGKDQLISAANNKVLAQGIKQVLRLQAEGWVEAAVAELFSVMTPASLPRVIPLSSRFDIAVCPYVVYKQQVAFRSEKTWVNPGMFISNVAKIDVASRKVDKQYHISGEDIIDLELPGENPNAQAVSEWMDAMPDEVVPERASAIMLRYFGNINTLGYPEGWAAIIDASVTANLTRPQLVGSQVGRALGKERPLYWYLPTDASLDGSTNCGKTLIAVALASITMFGIKSIYSNNSDSAPGIRSMAKPLMKFGGCVIDEFYAPDKPEHPFSYPGLQALATGGLIAPGEALGNADPLGVRDNMHFSGRRKTPPSPPSSMSQKGRQRVAHAVWPPECVI